MKTPRNGKSWTYDELVREIGRRNAIRRLEAENIKLKDAIRRLEADNVKKSEAIKRVEKRNAELEYEIATKKWLNAVEDSPNFTAMEILSRRVSKIEETINKQKGDMKCYP